MPLDNNSPLESLAAFAMAFVAGCALHCGAGGGLPHKAQDAGTSEKHLTTRRMKADDSMLDA
jgi:hypothetical protein